MDAGMQKGNEVFVCVYASVCVCVLAGGVDNICTAVYLMRGALCPL